MSAQLPIDPETLGDFCRRYGIRRLSLFGSMLRGTAGPESDVDLLVEFEPGRVPGLIAMTRMERELSLLLGGRSVDLRTPGDLSSRFREEVVRAAATQYAA